MRHILLCVRIKNHDVMYCVSGVVALPEKFNWSQTRVEQEQDDDFLTPVLMVRRGVRAVGVDRGRVERVW